MALRQQLITLSRQYKRSPKLNTSDRILFALLGSWIKPKRLSKIAILLKPATLLKFHKALVIGFSVHTGDLNGITICRMFNKIISAKNLPKYLSSDHDPLFKFHRWQANLRILDIEEIKSVPYTPTSHPFIERLVGTVRREYLDQQLFWNSNDLQNKLNVFQHYYNADRAHSSLDRKSPAICAKEMPANVISMNQYRWKSFARDLFQLPVAA